MLLLYGKVSTASAVELVEAGLCYYNAQGKAHLTYPHTTVRDSLEQHIEDVIALFADFAKGPALELHFRLLAYKGFEACTLAKQHVVHIPAPTSYEIQQQPGDVLEPPQTGQCVLIKLAENHVAVDFLIVDATELGAASKKLFFVQVSVMQYQERSSEGKVAAIHQPSAHTHDQSPWDYYTNMLQCRKSNSYYVYASPAESTFSKDRDTVYLINLAKKS